ncbi:hypothetical protein DM01DRAFT_1381166 [Hesseltinella vesiculosa]|uniref:Zn(2)-C6 fungal-type domain-containing protein n=1 Tax=Hesseltinella vesiculosa TaxID=101127 RepID=A0A1X2GRC3_9FUNG|nr:hypothetical protein DM01DRAFT_1381166 [Hesseltinella vesiculosa]
MFATLDLPLRDDNRHKRLKVGRACHPCRMKKIKCDGKQPCMQCKARRRKCSYLKNTDSTYIKLEAEEVIHQHDTTPSTPALPFTSAAPPLKSTLTRSDKMMEQLTHGLLQLTLHHDSSLKDITTHWRDYGDFVRWISEPDLPTQYTTPAALDMPPQSLQEELLQVFFTQCHHVPPILSKRMFYDQLLSRGPLISPLLLQCMYAHAACQVVKPSGHSSDRGKLASVTANDCHLYYKRARQLVDDFLDVPRISTVIALLYLASYTPHDSTTNSRAWMYGGMAVRMCLELGLHTSHYSSQMSQFDIELRKRVLWSCYVVDKLQSASLERPWMLRSQDIALTLPSALPEDDPQERHVLDAFAQLCRLMKLTEAVLHFFSVECKHLTGKDPLHHLPLSTASSPSPSTSSSTAQSAAADGQTWTSTHEARVLQFLDQLIHWREQLPPELQWQPHLASPGQLHPSPTSPLQAAMHLLSYDLELSLVHCCRLQGDQVQSERRRAMAKVITALVLCTLQLPALPFPRLSAHSGVFAALTHAQDLDHANPDIANEAMQHFRLSLEAIRALAMPMADIQAFVPLADRFLQASPSAPLPSPSMPSSLSNALDLLHHPQEKPGPSTSVFYDLSYRSFPTPFSTPSPPPPTTDAALSCALPSTNTDALSPATHPLLTDMTSSFAAMQAAEAAAAAAAAVGAVDEPIVAANASLPPLRSRYHLPLTTAATSTLLLPTSITIPTTGMSATITTSAPAHPPFGQPKNIEPGDYTFELISMDDEWGRSLHLLNNSSQ